ncbi:restriction endonuclease subunit S [Marinobacterium iners]|uniref:Type I restriction enzyme, S subunit n=1 Tax=Marinobacterium iners DSM 11526 TaxID=1122198 RepID=A0A1H3ZGL6_9GAMM|nr:restriction endonuclease subunit S [Marinobacterium iners]SEA22903.1 type I restriction enzyme, S subunit [Marinobacterium iners DSM 11526]
MSTSWPIWRLGELCSFENGDRGKNYPSGDAFVEKGIPFINAGNLSDNAVSKDGLNFITRDRFDLLSNGKIRKGDILFCLRGSLGKFAVVDDIEDGAIASSLVILRNGEHLSKSYLAHFLKSPLCKNQISAYQNGAAQPNLSARDLKSFEIPLPPLAEQHRIAAILDKADALRRKRQQAIDLADQFLRSVFLEMFGDPVTNPKGWDMVPMSEFSSFENGDRSSNYPSGEDIVDAGVLFLSTKNILQDELSLKTCQYITKEKFDSLSRGKARQGDLIITLRGTLGACCIFESEHDTAFINAQMMIIRPNRNATNVYLHDLITSRAIKAQLQKNGQGAAVPQLTAQQLKDLKLPLPPVELQNRYECVRQSVFNMVGKMKGSSGEGLFESVSQQAFRGEL